VLLFVTKRVHNMRTYDLCKTLVIPKHALCILHKDLEKKLNKELFMNKLHTLLVPMSIRITAIKRELTCGAGAEIGSIC
jgi:hypothetical protein